MLVGLQFEEGRLFIEHLIRGGFPVTAAAWLKETEGGQWYLYLATPLVGEDEGTRTAYRRKRELIRNETFGIENDEVKVISPHNPIAQAMIAARDRCSSRAPICWFRGNQLGPLEVDEAYIYPPITAEKPTPQRGAQGV